MHGFGSQYRKARPSHRMFVELQHNDFVAESTYLAGRTREFDIPPKRATFR